MSAVKPGINLAAEIQFDPKRADELFIGSDSIA